MSTPARQRSTDERLDEIERLLREVLRRRQAATKGGRRRSRTVAERAASEAVAKYRPTDLEMAAARRRLRRTG